MKYQKTTMLTLTYALFLMLFAESSAFYGGGYGCEECGVFEKEQCDNPPSPPPSPTSWLGTSYPTFGSLTCCPCELDAGKVAGVAVGVLIPVLLVIFCIWYCRCCCFERMEDLRQSTPAQVQV